jgi:IMP cyclohydrolase
MNQNERKLKENKYPGRGIVIGMTPDEKNLVQIYWIMGRSENSRNRIFVMEGDAVKTRAYIESKMTDPSLIIYYPVRHVGNAHIVTNGDQTDTIAEYIRAGKTFEEALLTRSYEPDVPNYTPRISAVTYYDGLSSSYAMSILKTIGNDPHAVKKEFYEYTEFVPGEGRCIHTYAGDGSPLPSFDGEPYVVTIKNDINETAKRYWDMLNEENRVSLLVKHIDISTENATIRIINKFVDQEY